MAPIAAFVFLILNAWGVSSWADANLTSAGAPLPISWSVYPEDILTLDGISFDKDKIEILKQKTLKGVFPYARLSGKLARSSAHLLIDHYPVNSRSDGRFSFLLPLQNRDFSHELDVVDPSGSIVHSRILVKFVAQVTPETKTTAALPPVVIIRKEKSRYFTQMGLNLAQICYEQTGVSSFTEKALTARASVQYFLTPSHVNFTGSLFFTGLPFASTQAEKFGISFFGFSARAAYEFGLFSGLRFNLGAGYHFTSSTSNGSSSLQSTLGYSVSALQIFAELQKNFVQNNRLAIYFRYSPLPEGSKLSTTSSEILGGLEYLFIPNADAQGFGVQLDYALTRLQMSELALKSSAASAGLSYHF